MDVVVNRLNKARVPLDFITVPLAFMLLLQKPRLLIVVQQFGHRRVTRSMHASSQGRRAGRSIKPALAQHSVPRTQIPREVWCAVRGAVMSNPLCACSIPNASRLAPQAR